MTRWEYMTVAVDPPFRPALDEELGELGGYGWELVSAATVASWDDGMILFLKRPMSR